ncbi:unnamed protein product [Larinioides sclopetarius]|uniref:Methylosome subunit pICln n=1 Tax=Larinioides sclopetarius TaxID=280406 RepID=A0AAV2BEF7_9ARAC
MVLLKNFPAPTEGIHHSEPDTRAYFGDECLGKGTLYISESVLCWLSSDGDGFSLKYPSIYIHAVSKDLNNFPHPCIYLMVDGRIKLGEDTSGEETQQLVNAIDSMHVGDGEDEEENTNEIRFVPDNTNMLDTIFRAIMDCQALNPDPEQDDDEDDDGVVIAPSFNIQVANGELEDFENGDEEYEEDMDDEDQFEDAES